MVSRVVTNRMGPNNADNGISIIISIFLVGSQSLQENNLSDGSTRQVLDV